MFVRQQWRIITIAIIMIGAFGLPASAVESNETPLVPELEFSTPSFDLENLLFVSGEVVGYDVDQKKLLFRTYLDEQGNPSQLKMVVSINDDTRVTDGENVLQPTGIPIKSQVDVEYHRDTRLATYIFVY